MLYRSSTYYFQTCCFEKTYKLNKLVIVFFIIHNKCDSEESHRTVFESVIQKKLVIGALTHKAPPIICSRRQLQIWPLFQK